MPYLFATYVQAARESLKASGIYTDTEALRDLVVGAALIANGWTAVTAVCFILFSLMHWPCSTTVLTVKKETGSTSLTLISVLLLTLFGVIICALAATPARLFVLA